jgi:hypothetical protein
MITNELLTEINTDIHTIPSFISGIDGKPYFDDCAAVLYHLKKICVDKFLTDDEIEKYIDNIQFFINKINNRGNRDYRIKCLMHLNILKDKYIEIATENELFEVASNLSKLII